MKKAGSECTKTTKYRSKRERLRFSSLRHERLPFLTFKFSHHFLNSHRRSRQWRSTSSLSWHVVPTIHKRLRVQRSQRGQQKVKPGVGHLEKCTKGWREGNKTAVRRTKMILERYIHRYIDAFFDSAVSSANMCLWIQPHPTHVRTYAYIHIHIYTESAWSFTVARFSSRSWYQIRGDFVHVGV